MWNKDYQKSGPSPCMTREGSPNGFRKIMEGKIYETDMTSKFGEKDRRIDRWWKRLPDTSRTDI